MIWLKKNLLFTIVMVFLTVVLVVEIIYVLGRRAHAAEAEREFEAKVEEYQALISKSILPHERNISLIQEEIALKTELANEYRESLLGRLELLEKFENPPASRADAFFDIASFVEEYRAKAEQAGLELPANEYFGFGAYATSGPDEASIPEVFRQRIIVAHILDRVFESRPSAFRSIVREGQARAEGPGRATGGAAATGGFRLDPGQSLAMDNLATTTAFQVSFSGRTNTLRTFVNSLTKFDLPLVVRHIDVSTTGVEATPGTGTGPRAVIRRGRAVDPSPGPGEPGEEPAEENVLIIPETVAHFTVSLEYLNVLPLQGGGR